ncbi:helix-turn-helix domain-containing protein [Cupriavidus oxalaticus]|uniref:Helix-turn-helix domain-containing protein n=1 Tax=Cupriavidus oxalaticus TaxID=96344 RepID=A0A5P3VFZ3_9BURK|nr:helix-turn-helix transcriptional regulator [Cupriavidus oxalaticus]QEZ44333.1 helix-turn-helix domain-containing protein [Cupriavidus oxalaticus]QRQ84303.1 helix-turn-helix transcriptional regulator [Cupriavidus oxalaticus]QRQ91610.1 helix-turn-helix transcriptional regulator [Cupriavidus oxalaticus]WQD86182.1 helix-turn-helix transcriptional regulator [Cupriavidus oxalaticus]
MSRLGLALAKEKHSHATAGRASAWTNRSSRTYISSLERGLKSPTLDKVDQIATALAIHPLTLLAYSYLGSRDSDEIDGILGQMRDELLQLVGRS